jgi:hypothetical protein
MFGWLLASISGLTRSATRASRLSDRAMAAIRSSSPADSALIVPTPSAIANACSSRVLPSPVKTISAGVNPARSATRTSPPEFASARLPSERRSRAIARVEFAFSA